MAVGGKHSRHPCSRALGPDRGSSAPGRPGTDRPTDPWRQPASAQPPGWLVRPPRVLQSASPGGSRRRGGSIEGASARGALGSCMRRRRTCGADGTTEFQNGEEHDLSSFKKMLLGAVTAMVLVAGVAVSPASAHGAVPRGDSVDTAGCERPVSRVARRARPPRLLRLDFSIAATRRRWTLEDWSRDPADFVPVRQELSVQRHFYNGCVYADWISQKPGVAFIKLIVHAAMPRTRLGSTSSSRWMDDQDADVTGGGTSTQPISATSATSSTLTAESVNSGPVLDLPARLPAHRSDRIDIRQGHAPALGRLQRLGPRRQPDDARRLGQVGSRGGALVETDHDFADYDHQLGHPRRLCCTTEGHVITAAQCDRQTNREQVRLTRSTTAPLTPERLHDFGGTHGGSRRSSVRRRRRTSRSARSIRSTRTTRCSPTARSTRVTRRCPPRRST